MSFSFYYVALVIAIFNWIAVARNWKYIIYLTKPGVMVALLIWLWQNGGLSGHMRWFAIGVLFSLIGDVFLILPREQFIAGLISFLLVQVSYTIGLNNTFPEVNIASLIIIILLIFIAYQIYRRITEGLDASSQSSLKLPIMAYMIAISMMVLSAFLTLVRPDWFAGQALMVSAGALLFFLSDTFLAWRKFIAPLSYGNLLVIINYHLGQALILLGAALHFLG
jgi:uncharacterized membrane protein YhhN